ncbi:uncharacterized protein LOC135830413 [Sycon ciliatum]|uniref:uncharacterized protein LOC135830413 n=1 Tax=Sycon ciliatum TaxID=27933 RepID=UPI0031F6F8E0
MSGKSDHSRDELQLQGSTSDPDTSCTSESRGESGNVKEGCLRKRHRNRAAYTDRFLQLDLNNAVLSYYFASNSGQERRRSSLLDFFRSSKKAKSGYQCDEDKLRRRFPVDALECHTVAGKDLDCDEGTSVLVISYREVQASYRPTISRNVYFVSKQFDEEADQEIRDWCRMIRHCKRLHHGRAVLRAKSLGEGAIRAVLAQPDSEQPPRNILPKIMHKSPTDDEDNDDEPLFKCGWVLKKAFLRPNKWHNRFLVVDNFRLRYYKSPMDALALNELPLYFGEWSVRNGMPDVFPERNHPHCFTLKMALREYHFRTDNADDTNGWVETLQGLRSGGNGGRKAGTLVGAGSAESIMSNKPLLMRHNSCGTCTSMAAKSDDVSSSSSKTRTSLETASPFTKQRSASVYHHPKPRLRETRSLGSPKKLER